MELDSVEISQLKADLLAFGSPTDSASKHVRSASRPTPASSPSKTRKHNLSRHVAASQTSTAHDRGSAGPQASKLTATASQRHSQSTTRGLPRFRMSDGTQKSVGTDVNSQWVYESSSASVLAPLPNGASPETYKQGETGYVGFDKLDGWGKEHGENNNRFDEDDDVEGPDAPVLSGARMETFAHPGSFRLPPKETVKCTGGKSNDFSRLSSPPAETPAKSSSLTRTPHFPETPATNGKKRDHDGNVMDNAFATPQLPPVNPFATFGSGSRGGISISQAFKLTQAPSSPFPNVLPSDATSNRPSPGMQYDNRPSTAGPSSSPAKMERTTSMKRSVTEPFTRWGEDSGKGQSTSSPIATRLRSSPIDDDPFDQEDSQVRRYNERRKTRAARQKLARVTVKGRKPTTPRKLIAQSPSLRSLARSPFSKRAMKEVVIVSDELDSEEETEHEEPSGTPDPEEVDELAEDNKENLGQRSVQVPRTSAKISPARRSIRRTPQSTPVKRRTSIQIEADSSSDELGAEPEPGHTPHSSRKSTSSRDQPIAIADSQESPSQRRRRAATQNMDLPPVLGSSNDSRKVIRESQTAKLANTSQIDSSYARRILAHPSSQLSSPPVGSLASKAPSTPAAMLDDTGRNSGKHCVLNQVIHPGVDSATRGEQQGNEKAQSRPTESGDQSERPEEPEGHGVTLASTIPETDSHSRQNTMTGRATNTASNATGTLSVPGDTATSKILFGTAQTHLEPSPEKTMVSSLRYRGGLSPSPKKSFTKGIKSMKEMAEAAASQEGTDDFSLSIDLMTEEDKQYQQAMENLSSPIAPGRKRRRGLAVRKANESSKVTADEDTTLSSLNSQERNQLPPNSNPNTTKKARASNDDTIQEKENASPLPVPAKSPSPSPSKQELAVVGGKEDNSASVYPAASIAKSLTLEEGAKEIAEAAIPAVDQSKRSKSATAFGIAASHALEHVDDILEAAPEKDPGEQAVENPMRVFAYFKGSPHGYFTATCISVRGVEPKYTVRFDDGSESPVNSAQVRRLELRPGDTIRVDEKGLRSNTYNVKSLQKAPEPGDESESLTDIFGNHEAVVTLKSKQAVKGMVQEQVFPLTSLYLTTQMWSSMKDRVLSWEPKDLAMEEPALHNMTPRPSSPLTPSIRHRSAKSALKTSTYQAPTSITKATNGLFANFIFAMTSISDTDIRRETESLIRTHGGRVLESGFEGLFSFDAPNRSSSTTTPSLTSSSRASTPASRPGSRHSPSGVAEPAVSFALRPATSADAPTLLLADKHSRNTKFFQALALGIPCLHTRWVRDCTTQKKILDWRPYLLASGESALLNGATVSRWLPNVSDTTKPDQWGLGQMMEHRNKWLDKKRVLLVGSGAAGKMEAYVFIALALGAKVVKVANGMESAMHMLHENAGDDAGDDAGSTDELGTESKQCLWDWVCVNEDERVEAVPSGTGAKKGHAAKRRKSGRDSRRDISEAELVEGLHRVKVVGTELVVQSLILGRLLDPTELDS